MTFDSYVFVLVFLPVSLIGYYILGRFAQGKLCTAWLFAMSLAFYGYASLWYPVILLASIAVNYLLSQLLIKRQMKDISRKCLFTAIILFHIGVLLFFKYRDFFLENVNGLLGTGITFSKLFIPLGISFFTFSQIAYIVDTYKGEAGEASFIEYAAFVSFFPKLLSGPIAYGQEIILQFRDPVRRKLDYSNFSQGLMAFSLGLAKKVLLADTFGKAAEWGYQNMWSLNTTNAVLVVLAYTLQIYLDFSSYCDMAAGMALMFNIKLPVNFNSPYKAYSIGEFWDRWHMTLTRFFTKYIYIPLGGSRKGTVRTYVNILIVFLVSGFWHGAAWTFVLWGMLHGAASVAERIWKKQWEKLHGAFRWIITFIFINITWVYFRAPSISAGTSMLKRLLPFQMGGIDENLIGVFRVVEVEFISNLLHLSDIIPVGIVSLMLFYIITLVIVMNSRNIIEKLGTFKTNLATAVTTIILLIWSIFSFSEITSFIYWNF